MFYFGLLVSTTAMTQLTANTCSKLYEQRNVTGDIRFVVRSEEIMAHRCVLAAISPKYMAQFYGLMPDSGNINVNDASAAPFNEFLKFFYAKNIQLTDKNIDDVLQLAKQSPIDDLVTECTNFLLRTVKLETKVCRYLQMAQLHSLKELQEKCDNCISVNIKKLFDSTDFPNYNLEMLLHILSLDPLDCKEIDVFDACMTGHRQNASNKISMVPKQKTYELYWAMHFIAFASG